MIESSFNIETAGILLRIVHGPETAETYNAMINGRTPHLNVHILSKGQQAPPCPNDAMILDGEDMYHGWLDMNNRKATLFIADKNPRHSTANALRRIISFLCAANGGMVLHSACMARNSRALLFYGKSGAGKTTICANPENFEVLNDDLTVVKKENNKFMAWGMPSVTDKQKLSGTAQGTTIAALFKLVKSQHVFLRRINPAQAAATLLAVPAGCEKKEAERILDLTANLTQNVACYELGFTPTPVFWRHIKKVMDKELL